MLILLVLAPVVGVIIFQSYSQERELLESVQSDLKAQADSAAAIQKQLLAVIQSDLEVLAQFPSIRYPLSGNTSCGATLSSVLNISSGRYGNLGVIDADGRVPCSALPSDPGLNLSDRDYFQAAMGSGEFSAGSFQVGRITGVKSINFAVPVRNLGGSITGVVFAAVPLSYLSEPVGALGLPEGASVSMTDVAGDVLFGSGQDEAVASYLEREAGSGDRAVILTPPQPAADVVALATVVTGTGQGVGNLTVSIPRDKVLEPIREQRRTLAAFLSFLLFAGMASGWAGSELLVVRPMRQLIAAAGRIGGGDLAARTGIPPSRGDFGRLAGALDRMAAGLEERERKRAETETRLSNLIGSMTDAVIIADAGTGEVILFNQGAEHLFDIRENSALAMPVGTFLPAAAIGFDPPTGEAIDLHPGRSANQDGAFESTGVRHDGSTFPVEVSMSSSSVEDRRFVTIVARDITEQKEARAAIERYAYVDRVTGLPNRYRLNEHLRQLLSEVRPDRLLAVLAIKLFQYEAMVQRFGFTFSDGFLREAGGRIKEVVGDGGFVAATSPGQFIVTVDRLESHRMMEETAHSIHRAFDETVNVEGRSVLCDLSMGVAYHPGHGSDPESLVRRASLAMVLAHPDATNVFAPEMADRATESVELLSGLKEALEAGRFEMQYQPKVDLGDGTTAGLEALLRWNDPAAGYVPPNRFIPVLENSGFMWPVLEWQFAELARHIHRLEESGRSIPVALNVSARALQDPRLPDLLVGALAPWNIDPGRVIVEVTETALMSDIARCAEICRYLADKGVRVSIDDFGAGQSPLAYLATLSVHEIKIDRSFVGAAVDEPKNRAIIEAVVGLCRRLGMKSVAEGIETDEQARLMRQLGCDLGQGYLFARPMPLDETLDWLDSNGVSTER